MVGSVGSFIAAYRELLGEPPARGTNTVVVAHAQRAPYVVHPVFDWMEQGACAVLEPREGGELGLLGLVRVGDWGSIGHCDVPVVRHAVEPRSPVRPAGMIGFAWSFVP